jgi:hypothetical protein
MLRRMGYQIVFLANAEGEAIQARPRQIAGRYCSAMCVRNRIAAKMHTYSEVSEVTFDFWAGGAPVFRQEFFMRAVMARCQTCLSGDAGDAASYRHHVGKLTQGAYSPTLYE